MVYVLNINKKPLMPCTEAKARKLLKQNKAKIVKRNPFTIQLLFECEDKTQPVNLGIDAGSKHIGVSATTEKKVLYEADVILRNDIVNLLSSRREQRRTTERIWLPHEVSCKVRQFNDKVVQSISKNRCCSNSAAKSGRSERKFKSFDMQRGTQRGKHRAFKV